MARDILTHVDAHTTARYGRVSVVPGLIAWDGCDCGALYLMVNQTYASDNWPMQKIEADPSESCGAVYEGAELVLQVMQCAPSALPAPTVAAQENAAMLVRRDAYETRRAVNAFLCRARDERDVEDFIVDASLVQGPQGGCVGTELRFRVALTWE
ncbi:hypothetical protein [Streptomyces sp. NPDC001781]